MTLRRFVIALLAGAVAVVLFVGTGSGERGDDSASSEVELVVSTRPAASPQHHVPARADVPTIIVVALVTTVMAAATYGRARVERRRWRNRGPAPRAPTTLAAALS
jgi:hypothetical protein